MLTITQHILSILHYKIELLRMRFILLSLIAILLTTSSICASSTPDPVSAYLERMFTFQRAILERNPDAPLEKNMKNILLKVAELAVGPTAFESMTPATLATCQTVAAAYICQQASETRLDTDPPVFLRIWDAIHQPGRPIAFLGHAMDYVRLLHPELTDPTPVVSKFAHQFQQQNVLNRIKHIAEKRIEYNAYLIEKWNALPNDEARRLFYYDFSGLSSDRKKIPKPMQDLLDTVILNFGESCEADKRSYKHFLALLSQKKHLLAQTFAQQKMFDAANKSVPKKSRKHMASNEGEESIFFKKIVFYMGFLDSELPILDREFFGQSVRNVIADSAGETNFLEELNVGIKIYNDSPKDVMVMILELHNFFPRLSLLNAEKWLKQLEALNRRSRAEPDDAFLLKTNTKRVEQSIRQAEIIQSITQKGAFGNRVICCDAHVDYMLRFFDWAVPCLSRPSTASGITGFACCC